MPQMSLSDPTRAPLAARLRPTTLDEFVGQAQVLDKTVRRLLANGRLPSLLIWGPPGVGKTTLARLLAREIGAEFIELSATSAGVKQMRDVADRAATAMRPTLLFIDEIHRLNKSQQDALLPAVEAGVITLVGATTENPFHEVNQALRSRTQLLTLEPHTDEDIRVLLDRALTSSDGLAGAVTVEEDATDAIVQAAGGDARAALNLLDIAAALCEDGVVSVEDVVDAGAGQVRSDRGGDMAYDLISALQKSIRGSDPDAAGYWLQRLLAGGEDPKVIGRRLIVIASEDIGMADRSALPTAVAAYDAVERVGLPEAKFALMHAAVALALAPKSDTITRTLATTAEWVQQQPNAPVPAHLRDSHYAGASKLGHGVGYVYPHSQPGSWADQQYLPDHLDGRTAVEPTGNGQEGPYAAHLEELRSRRTRG